MHVIIALLSIGVTTFAFVRPLAVTLRLAYVFVTLTVGSGVYLVVHAPSRMVQACTVGLVYLGITTIGIVAARAKLANLAKSST